MSGALATLQQTGSGIGSHALLALKSKLSLSGRKVGSLTAGTHHHVKHVFEQRFLYYGDVIDSTTTDCGSVNEQHSSLRCAMEEALLTNRTFVLPRHICIRPAFNIDAARIVNTSQTEMLLEDLFDLKAISKALPNGIVFADAVDWKQTLAAAQDAQTLANTRTKSAAPGEEAGEGGGGGEEEEELPAQYLVLEDGSVGWRELRDVPDYAEAKIVHRNEERPWRRACETRFNGTAVIYHGPPFAKYIRDLAMQLSEKLGHFVFLHVRRHNTDIMRDDASYLRCRHLDRDTRVPAIRRHIWRLIPENSTLYIATDEVNKGFFSGLSQWYDIRLARSFDHMFKGSVTNNYQVFAIEKHLSKFASFFVATFCDEADSYGWLGLHAFYCLCQDYQEGRRAQTIKDTSAGR
ncbi:hypothetical protein CLOM_g4097 [Closterium sp. NIES-68]|nr:hypothetical protein CLOM_g4097 [Closterium sp. NIES-68]GJP62941.1 hypothetical protein CLOP_g20004 [Closterium sp. NIES-67]